MIKMFEDKKIKVKLTPNQLKKNSFWDVYILYILSIGFGGSLIGLLFFYSFSNWSYMTLIFFIIISFLLSYSIAWFNTVGNWQNAPIWIKFTEDGIVYQDMNFWRSVLPRFVGKEERIILEGEPKIIPIEDIKFVGVNYKQERCAVNFKAKSKLDYLFMKDNIQVQSELAHDVIEWFRKNASPDNEIRFIQVKSLTEEEKETIRGEDMNK